MTTVLFFILLPNLFGFMTLKRWLLVMTFVSLVCMLLANPVHLMMEIVRWDYFWPCFEGAFWQAWKWPSGQNPVLSQIELTSMSGSRSMYTGEATAGGACGFIVALIIQIWLAILGVATFLKLWSLAGAESD